MKHREAGWPPPHGASPVAVPAGLHWDAVRVRESYGLEAVRRLGAACGAVIGDARGGVLYWLVRAGDEAEWGALPARAGVRLLGTGCWVTVPGAHRTRPPGPYWAVPYGGGRRLTDATLLHTALAHVLARGGGTGTGAARPGPDRTVDGTRAGTRADGTGAGGIGADRAGVDGGGIVGSERRAQ